MSLHRNPTAKIIELSRASFSPQRESTASDIATYQQLAEAVIPGFPTDVPFVLFEILGLERLESPSHTLLYSALSNQDASALFDNYFKAINPEWSMSSVHDLYFEPTIWCGEICGTGTYIATQDNPKWNDPFIKQIDRTYNTQLTKTQLELRAEFDEYLNTMLSFFSIAGNTYFSSFHYSYIIIIPVALDSKTLKGRRKLAALFLHWGSKEKVSEDALLSVYQRVLLFWHRHFTSELFEKQLLETETIHRDAVLFRSVSGYIDTIQDNLRALRTPMRKLSGAINAAEGVLMGAEECKPLFSGQPHKLNSLITVNTYHDWHGIPHDDKAIITAAIALRALSGDESARAPLWNHLNEYVTKQIEGGDKFAASMLALIPTLGDKNPTIPDLEHTYKTLRLWYHTANKLDDSEGLTYSLLAMVMHHIGIPFEGIRPELLKERRRFWVASDCPLNTVNGIALLHKEYGFKSVRIDASSDRTHNVLTLQLLNCKFDRSNFGNLVRTMATIASAEERGTSLGSTGLVMRQLIGKIIDATSDQETTTIKWNNDRGNVEIKFAVPEQIVITWSGTVS